MSRARRSVALVVGLAIIGAVAAGDVLAGARVTFLGTLGLAPFATAIIGAPAETVVVAIIASAVVLGGGAWDHTLASWATYVRWFAVTLSGVLAAIAAVGRERRELTRRRFELLARMSRIGNTIESVPDTAAWLAALIVPQVADVCILDGVRAGTRRRLHVRASGPRAERTESFLRRQGPDQPLGASFHATQAGSGQPTLCERVTPIELEQWAQSDGDRAELLELGLGSVISVPLQARGELIGTLTLLVSAASGRSYGKDDLEFATVIAGRAALALDIAGLSRRLTQLEQRLVGALGDVSDAVIVQDRLGVTLHATETALQLLGLDSFEELYRAPNGLLGLGLSVFSEATEAADPSELPNRRLLRGEDEAPPMLLQRASSISGEERWLRISSQAGRDPDEGLISVVSTLEDVTEAKQLELTNRTLGRASELLSASLDYQTTVSQIAEIVVERLADFAAVYMPDVRGELRRVAVAGSAGDKGRRMARELERWPDSPTGIESAAQALNEGRARVMNDISDETLVARAVDDADLQLWRELGLTASMAVPLSASGEIVGAMSLLIARPGRRFNDADLALAEELGRRAGQAIENARNYTTRNTIANALQEALRPPVLVAPPGWTLATWYVPAGEESMVGGDFYDVFPVTDGHVVFIGDVTGHGALAARLTGLARFTLRTAAELTQDPRMAVHRLDAALLAQPETAPVTAVCAHLADCTDGVVRAHLAVAGHPLPLLIRGGKPTTIGRRGTLAGAAAGADWPAGQVDFRPGDTVVFYTDGVTEARRGQELFGRERLIEVLCEGSPEPDAIVARVRSELARFQTAGSRDDMTMLAMRFIGVPDLAHGDAAPKRRRPRLASLRVGVRRRG